MSTTRRERRYPNLKWIVFLAVIVSWVVWALLWQVAFVKNFEETRDAISKLIFHSDTPFNVNENMEIKDNNHMHDDGSFKTNSNSSSVIELTGAIIGNETKHDDKSFKTNSNSSSGIEDTVAITGNETKHDYESLRTSSNSSSGIEETLPITGNETKHFTIGIDRVVDLPPDFRICRPGSNANESNVKGYRCAGKPYDNFMQYYQFPLVLNKNKKWPSWGKRSTIVPVMQEQKNLTFLLVGNSHTRQWLETLRCQYQDLAVRTRKMYPDRFNVMEHTFLQQQATGSTTSNIPRITFHEIINHPALYSRRWKENLMEITGVALAQYDVVFVGPMNDYLPEFYNTSLWTSFREYSQDHLHQEIDVDRYPHSRWNFYHITKALIYQKQKEIQQQSMHPTVLIWTSMFSFYREGTHTEMVKYIKNWHKKQNAYTKSIINWKAIDARKYIPEMNGMECSSDSRLEVTTCMPSSDGRYRDGHRCIGDKGGQPDLLVWDIVSTLWNVFF